MTDTQIKTAFAVAAAVVTFLLIQPQVQAIPLLMIVLGCLNVSLAVINPSDHAKTE